VKNSSKRSAKYSAKFSLNSLDSDQFNLKDKSVSAQFMSLNGRLKSKRELRSDFISPDVLAVLKRASKSLSRPVDSDSELDQILQSDSAKHRPS